MTDEVAECSHHVEGEEVSYSFKHRSSGLIPWLKSLLGYGESHWYVTNERLIKYDKIAGGLGF
ncbi:hypothetical protein [Halorussus caseinilyticus]|uniref:Uncharacterized protein n=1 Tax=Halorussus caseinilyticus TaxID=3034025 RepID=A0ABD5WG35_9EURY|nr:hypothetical protein [Halorussus sp. DT72]